MLYFFSGTDREKARSALNVALSKQETKVSRIVRVTDANTLDDLRAALRGGGMFEEVRAVVLDGVFANVEMRDVVLEALPTMKASSEAYYLLEEKPDADTRKRIEKYAKKSERLDAMAKKKDSSIFGIANALGKRDKRSLWINFQNELAKGSAPEAIHGVLFWGAKDFFMKSRTPEAQKRGKTLIASLAELPHEARRRGEDLEYALERFVLSGL